MLGSAVWGEGVLLGRGFEGFGGEGLNEGFFFLFGFGLALLERRL